MHLLVPNVQIKEQLIISFGAVNEIVLEEIIYKCFYCLFRPLGSNYFTKPGCVETKVRTFETH